MGLASLILILSFTSVFFSSDSAMLNQSKQQAEYYVSQIQNDKNSELYLWSLVQLCESNSSIRKYIDSLSEEKKGVKLPFSPFCGNRSSRDLLQMLAFEIQSPDLLIAALLKSDSISSRQNLLKQYENHVGFSESGSINYDKLLTKIISNEAIDKVTLPNSSVTFTHFLLLFNSTIVKSGIIPRDYLKESINIWLYKNKLSQQQSTLTNSISTITLFRALYIVDNYAEVEALYSSLFQDRLFPISETRLRVYRYLDYSMYRLGYYDRSLKISRTYSVPLSQYLENKERELNALILQGVYLIKIGKVQEAQEINSHVLNQAKKNNINVSQASLYNNLGITYLRSGDFDRYINFLFRALDEAKQKDNYSHQLDILNNLYIYYRQNNDPNTALVYLEKASDLVQKSGGQQDLGIVYTYLGTFYRKFKQEYTLSFQHFEKARNILNKENHFEHYLNLLFEEANLYKDQQNYNLAVNNLNEVIALSKDKSVRHFFEALVNKTAIHLKLQELTEAEQLLNKINDANFDQIDFKDIVKAKTVHAEYLIRTNKYDEAYALLNPVLQQTVDWAQNSTDTQTGFWNIEPEFLDAFQLMTDLLIKTDRPEEAIEVLDQLKTINDASLYQNPMVKSSLLNESELTQYQRLASQLDQLRKELLASSGSEQLELQSHINRLSAQKRTLDRKITSMIDKQPTTVREVQKKLDGYEAIVHTTELNDWYYIATILKNEVSFDKVRLDSSLRSDLSKSAEHLASGKTNLNNLYRVSEILGLNKLPSRVNKLTVIPDSYLYELPVDILPLTRPDSQHSYGSTTYLVERFNTHYLTSLSDFNTQSKYNRDYKWNFVGYGVSDFQSYINESLVPLPYAQTEVSSILESLTNLTNKTAFVDSASSKDVFKSTAKDARILHLATHSEVSERDPLFSSIYLSQNDATEDASFPGRVFAHELFSLNLSNDLIMLNSCESGSGSYLQGTGVMGISRALRYAGANSLVLNLWSVNDMLASEFATQFYKKINEGETKAQALRAAKIHMLKNNNANPHFWGSYILIGKDNALLDPFEKTNIYLASSFMLYFILLIAVAFFKDKNLGQRLFSKN